MYRCIYVYMYICIYLYVYMLCTCTCIHIHIYIYIPKSTVSTIHLMPRSEFCLLFLFYYETSRSEKVLLVSTSVVKLSLGSSPSLLSPSGPRASETTMMPLDAAMLQTLLLSPAGSHQRWQGNTAYVTTWWYVNGWFPIRMFACHVSYNYWRVSPLPFMTMDMDDDLTPSGLNISVRICWEGNEAKHERKLFGASWGSKFSLLDSSKNLMKKIVSLNHIVSPN